MRCFHPAPETRFYAGVDLHARSLFLCVLDRDGRELLARNLPAIPRRGLLCARPKGKLAVVWLHTPGKTAWATVHTVKRHGGRIEAVVTLEVDVPRSWLRRS